MRQKRYYDSKRITQTKEEFTNVNSSFVLYHSNQWFTIRRLKYYSVI